MQFNLKRIKHLLTIGFFTENVSLLFCSHISTHASDSCFCTCQGFRTLFFSWCEEMTDLRESITWSLKICCYVLNTSSQFSLMTVCLIFVGRTLLVIINKLHFSHWPLKLPAGLLQTYTPQPTAHLRNAQPSTRAPEGNWTLLLTGPHFPWLLHSTAGYHN